MKRELDDARHELRRDEVRELRGERRQDLLAVRRLWPVLLRAGAVLPTRVTPYQRREYDTNRADPYLLRVENAGGFKAYERAHREKVLATFTPKFAHLVPQWRVVPLIVEYAFHFGFY